MPRGQYNREAARVRREGAELDNANVIGVMASAAPNKNRIERGEDWGNRSRKVKGAVDYYEMAKGLSPSDAVYQWKRYSIYGQDQKTQQSVYYENGWSAVPSDRHPHLPSTGNHIIHEGLILMEQPINLYREARREDEEARLEQLSMGRESLAKTPQNTMERTASRVSANKERMTVDPGEYERE